MKYPKFLQVTFFISSLLLCGCAAPSTMHIPAVTAFELSRYLGKWYEIARYPHSFESDLINVSAEYSLLNDGTVEVINRGWRNQSLHEIKGTATFHGASDVGELEVTFFWPFSGDYRIIYLTDDYNMALVTSSTMNYLWILARTPEVSAENLAMLIRQAEAFGFSKNQLIYPQKNN